ncbi:hypothetical protein [Pantoea ananatis]|uniref:hypothetical protein n=1 Tax=Pantoea ananas TaxID=553 RepID=UPI001B30A280|nr:hypothetical protein [Pantoea ananatis]
MNTHNVNVKTAATETTETRVLRPNVNGLPSGVAQTLAFLGHLAEDGMEESERAELLLGSLLSLAEALRDAVPDWSARRPRLSTKIRKGITSESSKRISDNLQNIRKHCLRSSG